MKSPAFAKMGAALEITTIIGDVKRDILADLIFARLFTYSKIRDALISTIV